MNQIELLIWLNTVVAIIGTWLNAKQNRFGFVLWMITNGVFVAYNLYLKVYPQAALFAVYFALAVFGYSSWAKKKKEGKEAV